MITQPMDFNQAISFLLDKDQVPASWDSAHWALMEPEARIRAFFSAKVENARFLDRAQGLLFDYMAKVRDEVTTPDGEKTTALRVAGREHFVKLMRNFMLAEGMAKPEEFAAINQDDVQTLGSLSRLRLIFDTNVRQSYGYGQWKQGMTPAALRAFPAARLIRERGVAEARPRHAANIGQVRAKTDFYWWASYQNSPEIGGFGVPWGPYGFNSGVTQEDVSAQEAAALGVAIPPPPAKLPGLNDGLQASTRKMDPSLKAKLLAELRGGPKPADPREAAKQAAAQVRREMLNRGLTEALSKGDAAKAEKYRAALETLPPTGLAVREEPEKIVLETATAAGIVPVLPDEKPIPRIDESAGKRRPTAENPLESAFHHLGGSNEPDARESGESRENASVRQSSQLAKWAEENGLTLDPDAWLDKAVTGASEHDVWFEGDEYWKVTRPGHFGWTVIPGDDEKPQSAAATPLEYLSRWINANTYLGDSATLRGIAVTDYGIQIVVSHPYIAGPYPDSDHIFNDMARRGFVEIPGFVMGAGAPSFYRESDNVGVFDASEDNFISSGGIPIPVDVITLIPGPRLADQIRRLIRGD